MPSRCKASNGLKVYRNGRDETKVFLDSRSTVNLALALPRFDHPGQRLIWAELPNMKICKRDAVIKLCPAICRKEITNV